MALLLRARVASSALCGKLLYHPPIQHAFSSSSSMFFFPIGIKYWFLLGVAKWVGCVDSHTALHVVIG